MENTNSQDLIEQYLKGKLTGSEQIAFEKELSANPSLQQEVDKTNLLHTLLAEKRLLDLKKTARETYNADIQKTQFLKFSVLGALFLGAGVGTYWFLSDTKPKTENVTPTIQTHTIPENKQTPIIAQEQEESKSPIPLKKETLTDVKVDDQKSVKNTSGTVVSTSPKEVVEEKHTENTKVPLDPSAKEPIKETEAKNLGDACKGIVLKADMTTYPTCLHEDKGAVALSNYQGGTAPYSFKIVDKEGTMAMNQHLAAGQYTILLSDEHHCTTKLSNVWIKIKNCNKSYSFNPFIGEKWEIPATTQAGYLTIVDKAGNTYLSKEIEAGITELWDGTSLHGDIKVGYYLFNIKYTDGSEERGAVTIVK